MRRGPVTFDSTIVPDAAHCRSCKLLGGWWRRLWFDQQVLQGLHSACPHLLVMHRDLLLKLVLPCHFCTATAAAGAVAELCCQACCTQVTHDGSDNAGTTCAQLQPALTYQGVAGAPVERQCTIAWSQCVPYSSVQLLSTVLSLWIVTACPARTAEGIANSAICAGFCLLLRLSGLR